ncbi:MAG: hypothetical protein JO266_01995 [Acidobacteria bacterium]|nr:hypothetical protein [Acidobacteriota bacterium]MBV9479220.1 hypothetical protein [Acidobacteriota bacterium]
MNLMITKENANMEPVVAIFPSRSSADRAVGELLKEDVPRHAVAVLTPAEEQTRIIAAQLGTYVGSLAGAGLGMSLGVLTAIRLGLDQGFPLLVLGFGAAALIGLSMALIGRLLCRAGVAPGTKATANSLQRGHVVVIVSAESEYIASCAQRVLARAAAA